MLTDAGIRAMGFVPLPEEVSLSASFVLLKIDELRGLALPDPDAVHVHQGPGYTLAIGNSVNRLSQALVKDDFIDDEAEWAKEAKAHPPYSMIMLGPTKMHTATSGFWMHKDGEIITYDTFSLARQELAVLESQMVPPALSALSACFSDLPDSLDIIPRGRTIAGTTDSSGRLHDMIMKMSATAFISRQVSGDDVTIRMLASIAMQPIIDPDMARFYFMGMTEQDHLKRFMLFFLFIERLTHRTFASLKDPTPPLTALDIPVSLKDEAIREWTFPRTGAKTLLQRFLWCCLMRWRGISAIDALEFKQLKKERDRISHGERTAADATLSRRAQVLAAKIMRGA